MKTTETKIPVTIFTGYQHPKGNDLEIARQQIEKAVLYIESLFNLIKLSSEFLEESNDYRMQHYGGDLQHISEIGYGVADSILTSMTVFTGVISDIEESRRIDETAKPMFKQTDLLAVRLSEILNDAALPVGIYNAFMSALDDVRNELPSAETQELEKYETSPEYLKTVFAALKNKTEE
jgi:hypothetical protein